MCKMENMFILQRKKFGRIDSGSMFVIFSNLTMMYHATSTTTTTTKRQQQQQQKNRQQQQQQQHR
jgi:hypothetical protein